MSSQQRLATRCVFGVISFYLIVGFKLVRKKPARHDLSSTQIMISVRGDPFQEVHFKTRPNLCMALMSDQGMHFPCVYTCLQSSNDRCSSLLNIYTSTRRKQDDRPQHCLTTFRLLQLTATRHIDKHPRQTANDKGDLSSSAFCQCHRFTLSAQVVAC